MPDAASIIPLSTDRIDEVIDVFADAFSDYPVMRFTVGPEGDVAARMRRLIQLFVTRTTMRGGPMYGVAAGKSFGDAPLAGAILLTLPNASDVSEVAEISAQAWRELGDDARLRYEAYAAAARFFTAFPPHLHLNMIGVRSAHKGTGVGRQLLDAVRALAETRPDWSGVSLTTENPRNVRLYEHFGYEVVGHARVPPFDSAQGKPFDSAQGKPFDSAQGKPGFETWGMFLRK